MQSHLIEYREVRHAHFFAGLGGGAKGFNKGHARVGNMEARFRCIGGIDNNAAAIRDFKRLTGVDGMMLDLFDYEQYKAFHGCEPPPDWREATVDILLPRKSTLDANIRPGKLALHATRH